MKIQSELEVIAKAVMLADPGDLPGLVELQERLEAFSRMLVESSLEELAAVAQSAAGLLSAIVMREIDDADEAFEVLRAGIQQAQRICDEQLVECSQDEECADQDVTESVSNDVCDAVAEVGDIVMEATDTVSGDAEDEAIQAVVVQEIDFSSDDRVEAEESMADAIVPSGASALVSDASAAPLLDGFVVLTPDPGMADNLGDFICESREHLAGAEESLLQLEQDPGDNELVNTVFRAFHTIKGVAGFMHLTAIVSLAHEAEFLLDAVRTGKLSLTSGHIDHLLHSCDLMGRMIGMLEDGPACSLAEHAQLIAQLRADLTGEAPAPAPAAAAPPSSVARPVDIVSSPPEPSAAAAAAPASDSASAPAPAESTDDDARSRSAAAADVGASRGARRSDQTVKVSTQRMDNLVTMVGELVIAQQMVIQDMSGMTGGQERVQRNLGHVGKIIRDLQEVAMALRMVTLRSTFQRMTRLVRDVSAKAGKKIVFLTEGEDVELDRNVVDEIADPLVHMIRNACDHGIEPASERLAAGKPESGHVTLRAYHSGGSIVVEVQDDGRGLSRERILKKAIERGIYQPDRDPAEIPDAEIYNLVFLPGFSTAEKVTDISGRGVGMDVVRRNIEALRGKCEIRSVHGEGTVFMMKLPLTMAIIDGMIVRTGKQRYVLPTLSIEQSFRPRPQDVHTVIGRGEMVSVRGGLLPIYRLNRVLGLHEGHDRIEDALLVVLESNDARCALMVDEIIGQQQVVIKSLGQGVGSLRGVSGGAILGDGRVALILDVSGIVTEATKGGGGSVAAD